MVALGVNELPVARGFLPPWSLGSSLYQADAQSLIKTLNPKQCMSGKILHLIFSRLWFHHLYFSLELIFSHKMAA